VEFDRVEASVDYHLSEGIDRWAPPGVGIPPTQVFRYEPFPLTRWKIWIDKVRNDQLPAHTGNVSESSKGFEGSLKMEQDVASMNQIEMSEFLFIQRIHTQVEIAHL
jgi:hypothetical protein